MTDHCRHCFVSGRVQGVFFRASTRAEGRRLGLEVQVRNLRDGRVEVLARGPSAALDELSVWLHEGPPHARVAVVVCKPVSLETYRELSWS